jgi:threonine dehydratase
MSLPVHLDDIQSAAVRIQPYVHQTPVLTCSSLDQMAGASLFFKCENLQKAGAFKFRGASNAVFSLSEEEARKGVATHSSGNHGAALSLAAKLRGIPAHIVMPSTAPRIKQAAVKGYGGIITTCEPTLASRESTLKEVAERTGATFIHPYNDPRVIAGQGTCAAEFLEQIPDLDIVIVPVGGGGLLSGTAVSISELSPGTKVVGAEPANADDAYRSLKAGRSANITG